jgi:hypothetical protein
MAMRTFLSLALAAALCSPAFACLNDTELRNHDREFKSQYRESQYQPPQPQQTTSSKPYVLGGAGTLMAVAGVALLLRLRSQPR